MYLQDKKEMKKNKRRSFLAIVLVGRQQQTFDKKNMLWYVLRNWISET